MTCDGLFNNFSKKTDHKTWHNQETNHNIAYKKPQPIFKLADVHEENIQPETKSKGRHEIWKPLWKCPTSEFSFMMGIRISWLLVTTFVLPQLVTLRCCLVWSSYGVRSEDFCRATPGENSTAKGWVCWGKSGWITPLKFNINTKIYHIWKEIHLKHHHYLVSVLNFGRVWLQGSLYIWHQPKQCNIKGAILQIHHAFEVFHW